MKTCFKCRRILPLDQFYDHPKMADGKLGKCKKCAKEDSDARRSQKEKDPKWRESELDRQREKSRRYRERGAVAPIPKEKRRITQSKHREKYPEKYLARKLLKEAVRAGLLNRQPCAVCLSEDSEGHHEDYSKPLEVIWLCPAHHAERHVQSRKEKRLQKLST